MHAAAGVQGCSTQECFSLTKGSYGTGIWGELMLDLTDWQNKKYVTVGSNTPVRILCIDAGGSQPIVGIHDGSIERWSIDGTFDVTFSKYNPSGCMNLVNAKTKREGWVNVYEKMRDNSIAFLSDAFPSEEEANKFQMYGRIACVRIEWEE